MNAALKIEFMPKVSALEKLLGSGQSEIDEVMNSIRLITGKDIVAFRTMIADFFEIPVEPMKTPRLRAADEDEYGDLTDIVVHTTYRLFPANPGSITPRQFEQWGQEIISSIEQI
jgi:hypothetical protein